QHCYWITGPPGSGKSTLAATFARRLKKRELLYAQYFISRNVPETTAPEKLFPTLALQLAQRSVSAAAEIKTALRTRAPGDLGFDQAQSFLLGPLKKIADERQDQMILIVIDALDE
ncbi:hypothetical protein M422DRAFT_136869, partial [Sphaerobolus stellatus SS14]